MADLQPLTPVGETIMANVMAALQDAEEIWGYMTPEEYVNFMATVKAECDVRITNCKTNNGME